MVSENCLTHLRPLTQTDNCPRRELLDGSEAEIVELLHGAWADDSCLVQAQCSLMDGGELIAAMLLCHGSLFRISNAVSSDLSFLRDFVPPNLALGSKRAIGNVSAEAVECEEPEIE
jgi:hypothetical protein